MARLLKHPLEAFRDGNGQMSQAEAAALVGITQEMWSRLERGTAYASPAVAKRISELTGIDRDLLMNFGDKEPAGGNAPADQNAAGIVKDMP